MGLLEQLQEQGWYITQPGLEKLLESDKSGRSANPDVKQVVKLALNTDLRDYGGGALSSLSSRATKLESFDGSGVVQLVKLRNLGAPKVNEESKTAPRLLKLTVTDGQTQYVALEHEPIPSLSLNTPPGTKILLKNGPIRIASGVMLLSEKNVTVLGGQVTALVEKWELSRTMAKYAKGGRLQFSTSGPPPWIPFGQKIQQPTTVNSDKDFKSLQTKEKEESKENSEFNALRNDAIAEATKLGTKKTFGGGAKQMVDANVQKIMDRGFTEDQANHALKLTRNNVDRALSNLQRIEGRKQAQAEAAASGEPPEGDRRVGGKRGFSKRDDESELHAKPLGKVSLFDYFGDILQDSEPQTSGGNGTGGKKTANKESSTARGSDGDQRSATTNSRNPATSSSHSAGRNHSEGNSHYAGGGGVTNGGSATTKNYNQRFENNISSSFANRNTSSTGGSGRDRGRDQGHYSGQQQQQSSYKQQSDYYGSAGGGGGGSSGGGNSRYNRGANENHSSTNHSTGSGATSSGASRSGGGAGGNSRTNESKYNQQSHQSSSSTAGYGTNAQQRSDGYHGNTNNSTATTSSSHSNNATGGSKYGGSKGNSTAYGNSYGSEGRNNQHSYGNDGRGHASGKGSGGAPAGSGAAQQSSYGTGSKQSNYNQQGSAGNHPNSQGHYGQQSGSTTGSNNNGTVNNTTISTTKNSGKNSRYGGKEESHKHSEGTTAGPAVISSGSSQLKKHTAKGHGSQNQPVTQSSYGPPAASTAAAGGGKHQQVASNASASSSGKMNQLSDQLGSMHVSASKSPGAGSGISNTTVGATNAVTQPSAAKASGPMKQMGSSHAPAGTGPSHQQQAPPMVASPPGAMLSPGPAGGPSPGTPSNVGPKNFIQLPNGYNYNPYQIMGFQNKQTNEFALNVLKSQQQFEPAMAQPATTQLGVPTAGPPAAVSPVSPGVGLPMAATGAPTGVLVPTPAVIAQGPTAQGVASVPIAATGGTLTMASTIGPTPIAVGYPNWKIGDRCLAKYWEDGGFYPAQITDTSKNTFVVHFLEYGNFEEVLKTDCIPIGQPGTGPGTAAPATMALGYHPAAQPVPSAVSGPPVQYAPHPQHAPLSHGGHHGHVPPHHAPPPSLAGPPAAYPADFAPYKAQGVPSIPQTMVPGPAGQPMNQYPTATLHLQQQPQAVQPQHLHHQQQTQGGGHMPQHLHHHQHQQMQSQPPQSHHQRSSGGKFREQRPMYVPPAQRK